MCIGRRNVVKKIAQLDIIATEMGVVVKFETNLTIKLLLYSWI
jgi:hypothetical protein